MPRGEHMKCAVTVFFFKHWPNGLIPFLDFHVTDICYCKVWSREKQQNYDLLLIGSLGKDTQNNK